MYGYVSSHEALMEELVFIPCFCCMFFSGIVLVLQG